MKAKRITHRVKYTFGDLKVELQISDTAKGGFFHRIQGPDGEATWHTYESIALYETTDFMLAHACDYWGGVLPTEKIFVVSNRHVVAIFEYHSITTGKIGTK